MSKKYLFHGTQNLFLENMRLEPRTSVGFNKPCVYATDDFRYALVRAGKQEDLIREEYYGKERPFELAECFSNAFKDMFDCRGCIYLLDPDDFEDHEYEFTSSKPVVPVDMIVIPNIWDYMRRINIDRDWYDLHWYDDEEYWKQVRGGREGFIVRKQLRKMLLEAD